MYTDVKTRHLTLAARNHLRHPGPDSENFGILKETGDFINSLHGVMGSFYGKI